MSNSRKHQFRLHQPAMEEKMILTQEEAMMIRESNLKEMTIE